MLIENVDALKTWLVKTVEPICDADPQTLSKYVVALIKKDKSTDELKEVCLRELDVFLSEQTSGFVEKLFGALQTKSYIGGGPAVTASNLRVLTGVQDTKPVAKIPATRSINGNQVVVKKEPLGDDLLETVIQSSRSRVESSDQSAHGRVDLDVGMMADRRQRAGGRDMRQRSTSGERRRREADRGGGRYRESDRDRDRDRVRERDRDRERDKGRSNTTGRRSRERRLYDDDLRNRLRSSRSRSPSNRRTRRDRTPVHVRLGVRTSRSPEDARRRLRGHRTPDSYRVKGGGYMRSDARRSSRSRSGSRSRALRRSHSGSRSRAVRRSQSGSRAIRRSHSGSRSRAARRSHSGSRSRAVRGSPGARGKSRSRTPPPKIVPQTSRSDSLPRRRSDVLAAGRLSRSPVDAVRKRSRSRSASRGREIRLRTKSAVMRSRSPSGGEPKVEQSLIHEDIAKDDAISSSEEEDEQKYRITVPLDLMNPQRQHSKISSSTGSNRYPPDLPIPEHQHRSISGSTGPNRYLPEPVAIPAALPVHQRLGTIAAMPPQQPAIAAPAVLVRPRCRDYDDKGFCLRGDLCPFDHGADPLVVDDLNLSFAASHPPPNYNRPPPPLNQPINPQLPGPFGMAPRSAVSLISAHRFAELAAAAGQQPVGMGAVGLANVGPSASSGDVRSVQMSGHHPPVDQRISDGVEVSYSGSTDNVNAPVMASMKKSLSETDRRIVQMRETVTIDVPAFDRGRLGIVPSVNEVVGGVTTEQGRSLIIDNIPSELNKIEHINSHFSRYGRIVNLQVCYGGSLTRALVCYNTSMEADAAYNSSEPVLSNRFIKILRPTELQQPQQVVEGRKLSVKARLGGVQNAAGAHRQIIQSLPPAAQHLSNQRSVVVNRPPSVTTGNKSAPPASQPVRGAALKLNRVVGRGATTSAKPRNTQSVDVRSQQMELMKQKQQLLQKQIEQQKVLLAKVQQPTLAASEKDILKEMIRKLDQSSTTLKADLQKLTALLSTNSKPSLGSSSAGAESALTNSVKADPQEIRRQLLDAELELMSLPDDGKESTELRGKINLLRVQAAGYMRGEAIASRGRGAYGRGAWPARGRGVGRGFSARGRGLPAKGRGFSANGGAGRLIDRRSRQLLVSGFNADEVNSVVQHLGKFGRVEGWQAAEATDTSAEGSCNNGILVNFVTRKDAEKAAIEGLLFNDKSLKMIWHQATPTTEHSINESKAVEEDNQSEHSITDATFMGDTRLMEALREQEQRSKDNTEAELEDDEQFQDDEENEADEAEFEVEADENEEAREADEMEGDSEEVGGYEEGEEQDGDELEQEEGEAEEQTTILLDDATYDEDDLLNDTT